jgi:hypothetical protein
MAESSQMTEWVDARLAEAGLSRTGALERFRERPWATVWHADTAGGPFWLKAPNAENRFEVGLYALLVRVVPDHVLAPLGVDVERGWLLLPDAGPACTDLLPALPRYAALQRALAPHVDELLALGVADMRPHVMPQRLDEAVEAIAGGEQVLPARERYVAWCEELAAAPGGASLDHNDLHDRNVLASGRFYDWGDSVVAHPFASLLVPLEVTKGDPRARDAYLDCFADLAPHAELVRIADLACRVARVARALVWHRADPRGDAPLHTLRSLL